MHSRKEEDILFIFILHDLTGKTLKKDNKLQAKRIWHRQPMCRKRKTTHHDKASKNINKQDVPQETQMPILRSRIYHREPTCKKLDAPQETHAIKNEEQNIIYHRQPISEWESRFYFFFFLVLCWYKVYTYEKEKNNTQYKTHIFIRNHIDNISMIFWSKNSVRFWWGVKNRIFLYFTLERALRVINEHTF